VFISPPLIQAIKSGENNHRGEIIFAGDFVGGAVTQGASKAKNLARPLMSPFFDSRRPGGSGCGLKPALMFVLTFIVYALLSGIGLN
jgi:hypothetical protein